LVEPLEPDIHVSPKSKKRMCVKKRVSTSWKKNESATIAKRQPNSGSELVSIFYI
jgi:hypothetical protein